MSASAESPSLLDQVVAARKALFVEEYNKVVALIHTVLEDCKTSLMINLDLAHVQRCFTAEGCSNSAIDHAIETFKLPGVVVERAGWSAEKRVKVTFRVDEPTHPLRED